MKRCYYSESIDHFRDTNEDVILGRLAKENEFSLESSQREAWLAEIRILKDVLKSYEGHIFFEYSIPRMGERIDVVLLIGPAVFVLEFKVGEREFHSYALDQVCDYALDLKNFHEPSHCVYIAPILIPTEAQDAQPVIASTAHADKLLFPVKSTVKQLNAVIRDTLLLADGSPIDAKVWTAGRYCPTPTIIEAAMALYGKHSVAELSRNDAGAVNLTITSETITQIIHKSREERAKSICFVTGVPGAGKTLVGLDVATKHIDKANDLYSVFLSGNGPLVAILRESLARDKVKREKEQGRRFRKGQALGEVKMFIQNVHHFRDDCLEDESRPPVEHVALFDEAQRAWNVDQTSSFMRRKKKVADFRMSEPEFLMSCLNRHPDWAVVVCLVGGGQEINTGEAGIGEWVEALNRSFPDWRVYISPNLTDSEYGAGEMLEKIKTRQQVEFRPELHLAVSMRSFRAEYVSLLMKQILDRDEAGARQTLASVSVRYPIVITRDLAKAKNWLRTHARGSERYGIVVSSQAERLKPHAIDVRSPTDPVHWFLDGKEDVRSSFYLEDVATEFDIQGLELDWACVAWDADFRCSPRGWEHWSFCGSKWRKIKKPERQAYLKNAYRVLLTRARQGMVIVVPPGDTEDATRNPASYDATFEYLQRIGFLVL